MIVITVSAIVVALFLTLWSVQHIRERNYFKRRVSNWGAFAESLRCQRKADLVERAVFDALEAEGMDAGLARGQDTFDILGIDDDDFEDFLRVACQNAGVSFDELTDLVDPERGAQPLKTVEDLVKALGALSQRPQSAQHAVSPGDPPKVRG